MAPAGEAELAARLTDSINNINGMLKRSTLSMNAGGRSWEELSPGRRHSQQNRPGSKQRPRGPGAHATASADSVGPPRLTHERLQQYAVAHAALTAPARPTTAAPRSVAGGSVPGALRKLASQPSGLLPSPAPPQPLASAVPRPTPRRAASVAQMPSPGNPITPASALNPIPTVRFALSASGKGPPSPPARGGPPPGTVSASWDATAWTQQAPVPPRPGASSPPAHAPPPERAFGPRAAEYPARSVSAPRPAHLQGGIFGPQAWYDRHVSSHHVVTGTGAGHPGSPGVPGAQGHGGGVGTGGGPRVSGSGSARSAAVRASAPSGLRAGPAAYDTINQQTHTQPQASQQQQQQQQPAKRGLQLVEPTVSRLHVADPTRRGGQGQGRGAGLHGSGGAAPWDPGSGDPWVRRGHCHGQSQSQRALRPGSRTIPSSRQRAAALEQQLRRMQQERAGAGGGEGAAGGLRRAPSDAGTNASWWQSAGGSEASYPMTAVTDRRANGVDDLSPSEVALWADRVAALEAEVAAERESRRRYEHELQQLQAVAGQWKAPQAGTGAQRGAAKGHRGS